jgi:hypothetical protein
MTFKECLKRNLNEQVFNLVKIGFNLPEVSTRLGLHVSMVNRLYEYERTINKECFVNYLQEVKEVQFTLSELAMTGESYKRLYLPHYEEKQTITKMSKV